MSRIADCGFEGIEVLKWGNILVSLMTLLQLQDIGLVFSIPNYTECTNSIIIDMELGLTKCVSVPVITVIISFFFEEISGKIMPEISKINLSDCLATFEKYYIAEL